MTNWYTGAGDQGSSKDLKTSVRVVKSDLRFQALGALDEITSLLGVCKMESPEDAPILEEIQYDLFTIQAEVAGADMNLPENRIAFLEQQIDTVGVTLPEIQTFLVPGGSRDSAYLDLARTVARRAEREVVHLNEQAPLSATVLAYMNRLSSILYVLARRGNVRSGITDKSPEYRKG